MKEYDTTPKLGEQDSVGMEQSQRVARAAGVISDRFDREAQKDLDR